MSSPIVLSPSQQKATEAFKLFLLDPNEKEFLITGAAGVGKSFITKYLIEIAEHQQGLVQMLDKKAPEVTTHYAATTNKAASVLENMIGAPAKTIFKLLGISIKKNFKTGTTKPYFKDGIPAISNKIIFLDESSMVSIALYELLQKVLDNSTNAKIIYIGDDYQLPPVKEPNCIVFQKTKNRVALTEIHRQAAGNPIIQLAHKYRELLDDPTLPFPVVVPDHQHIYHYTDHAKFKEAISVAYNKNHDPDDLRIAAWRNARIIAYNTFVRRELGLTDSFSLNEYVVSNGVLLGQNNRVLIPTDGVCKILNMNEDIRNGVAGIVYTLRYKSETVTAFAPDSFADKRRLLARHAKAREWTDFFAIKDGWLDLRPLYASTTHKLQGSTHKEVFIDLADIAKNNKWEEVVKLAYVAITRASDIVHIYGEIADRYPTKPTAPTPVTGASADSVLSTIIGKE